MNPSQQPILVYVEDDPNSRQIMTILLSTVMQYKNVFIFDEHTNLIERLDAFDSAPDVVFLDIHMQPRDGFALFSEIKAHPRYANTKLIALTASVTASEVGKLQAVGFDGLIGKPIKQGTFPKQLADILAGTHVWIVP